MSDTSAIVFDFDGLVLDTETVVYASWRREYRAHGHDLPIEDWIVCLGRGSDYSDFHGRLEKLTGKALDREGLKQRRNDEIYAELATYQPLPGVAALIDAATARGVPLAVCSGSGLSWVRGHLERLGLFERFGVVVTGEDTERHKPDPDPFLLTAERLGVAPGRCVVLEDSLNGVVAAKAAGMAAVAVPTAMTAGLDFTPADLRVASLADVTLDDLLGLTNR